MESYNFEIAITASSRDEALEVIDAFCSISKHISRKKLKDMARQIQEIAAAEQASPSPFMDRFLRKLVDQLGAELIANMRSK
jgi:hypothetical protein